METQITYQYYSEPEYQAQIEVKKTKVFREFELLASQHGKSGFPKTKEEFIGAVLRRLQNSIQVIADGIHERFLPFTTIGYAQTVDGMAQSQVRALQAEKNTTEKKIDSLETESDAIKPRLGQRWMRKVVFWILCFVSVVEGYFSVTALRNIMPSDVAYIMGILVAFGTGFGSHFLAGWIHNASNLRQFYTRYFISLLLASSVFTMLAVLRANSYNYLPEYVSQLTDTSLVSANVSAIPFALISICIFWLCIFISIKHYLTKSQRALEATYVDLQKEIHLSRKEIARIDKSIDTIERNALEQKVVAARTYEFASTVEASLQTFAISVLNNYVAVNHNYRADYPNFFADDIVLTFKTYFPPIQNQNNEKA